MSWITIHLDDAMMAALEAAAADVSSKYPTLRVSREDIARSAIARWIETQSKPTPAAPVAPVVAEKPARVPVQHLSDLSTIDERMRWLRRCANLSQRAVDRAAGVRRGIAWAIENGGDSHSVSMMQPVANLFGVSLDWLLSGMGDRPSPRAVAISVADRRVDLQGGRR